MRDPSAPELTYLEALGPAPFSATVTGFFEFDGELRGGTALIDQPGHPYEGWHVVFSTRHQGIFDLRSDPGDFNLTIGPALMPGELPSATGPGAQAGFGFIRDEAERS